MQGAGGDITLQLIIERKHYHKSATLLQEICATLKCEIFVKIVQIKWTHIKWRIFNVIWIVGTNKVRRLRFTHLNFTSYGTMYVIWFLNHLFRFSDISGIFWRQSNEKQEFKLKINHCDNRPYLIDHSSATMSVSSTSSSSSLSMTRLILQALLSNPRIFLSNQQHHFN